MKLKWHTSLVNNHIVNEEFGVGSLTSHVMWAWVARTTFGCLLSEVTFLRLQSFCLNLNIGILVDIHNFGTLKRDILKPKHLVDLLF